LSASDDWRDAVWCQEIPYLHYCEIYVKVRGTTGDVVSFPPRSGVETRTSIRREPSTLILAALLAAAPFAACAEDLSYSYVEGGWNRTEVLVNGTSDNLGGGYLRGSWQIAEPVYVLAGYQRANKDFNIGSGFVLEGNVQQTTLGVGYRQEMNERVEFTTDISVVRTKVESDVRQRGRSVDASSDSSNLILGNVGLRGKPSPRTEAWVKAGYIDGSHVDKGEFVGTLGGQVNVTPTWGLVGEVQFIDNANQYRVGVRATF